MSRGAKKRREVTKGHGPGRLTDQEISLEGISWQSSGYVSSRAWVQSLVKELRSHKPCGAAKKKKKKGTSLVVQWLRLHVPNAEGLGSISGQRTGSHMPQLKIMYATAESLHSRINIFKKITGEHLLHLVIKELWVTEITELYTLHGCLSWCVNSISVELSLKNSQACFGSAIPMDLTAHLPGFFHTSPPHQKSSVLGHRHFSVHHLSFFFF